MLLSFNIVKLKRSLITLGFIAYCILPSTLFAQGFTFNFTPKPEGFSYTTCEEGEEINNMCQSTGTTDSSAFSTGAVTINGQNYQHTIVGDPTSGFAQETFISYNYIAGNPTLVTDRRPVCASNGCDKDDPMAYPYNGKRFPDKVVTRQVMSFSDADSNFYSEFLKDDELTKPLIIQNLDSGPISTSFEMDARHLALDENQSTPLDIANTLYIDDPTIPFSYSGETGPDDIHFDIRTDAQENKVDVTAFQAVYDAESDIWIYSDPDTYFNHDIDYSSYFDQSQNLSCNAIRPECIK